MSKSRTGFVSFPCLARTRLISGARPRRASVFPNKQEARLLFPAPGRNPPGESPRQTSMNTQNVGPNVPPRTETPEKLSSAPWLFGRFPCQPAVCGLKGRLSRPAARKKERTAAGRRNGVRRGEAPRESLSTFFSEESRGPSRPERQVKRDLRGKSQAEKGKRQKKKRAHKRMAGRQRQRRPDQAQKYQTTHKPGTRQRHTGRKKAGAPYTKAATAAAARTRTTSPPHGAAHWAQKNPSEQAKFAFALLPARRGLVNRGRQKIASLFLAGTVFFCCALLFAAHCAARGAAQKGRRPLLSPASFLKKA